MKSVTDPANLKSFAVRFTLPELSSVNYIHCTTAKASDMGTALNRAWKDVKTRQGVKGHRITQMTISVVEVKP